MRYYCTYFDRNYFLKALALFESLNTCETQPFTVFAVCMDEISHTLLLKMAVPNIVPVPMHELEQGDDALVKTKADRTVVEYYWTTTPTVILRMLERNPQIDVITYLDADLYFFSSPDPIFKEFGDNSILIHEHRFPERLRDLENNGIYNVGLMCFRNDADGLEALQWWRERCIEWCYFRYEDGKLGDQMYLNDWPERFKNVVVLQHIGAGTAPWNHEQYEFLKDQNGQTLVSGLPLVFYHFHAFFFAHPLLAIPAKLTGYPLRREILELCYIPYAEAVLKEHARVKKVLPTFIFGMNHEDMLRPEQTLLAKNEIVQALQQQNILQVPFQLNDTWTCFRSEQFTESKEHITFKNPGVLKNSEAFKKPEPQFLKMETVNLWPEGKTVRSPDDLLLELRNRPITREIKTMYMVGAHLFQEEQLFFEMFPNLEKVYLFEPLPFAVDVLKTIAARNPKVEVFAVAVSDHDGTAEFHVTDNQGQSSSLLPLGQHKEIFPEVHHRASISVKTQTLDSIIAQHDLPAPDMLFLDVQGAEFTILNSLSKELRSRIKLVYTEVSTEELYVGAKNLAEVRKILEPEFQFAGYTPLQHNTPMHGNAVFVRENFADMLSFKKQGSAEGNIRVSALVSTYNAEKFFRGRLEDLVNQTLFKKGELEIIIVDSGSPTNERAIAEEFQQRFKNIIYQRTERETIYAAWNRAVNLASGQYLTNANTDDRLRPDALEIMADTLDKESAGLVYCDSLLTWGKNETFENNTADRVWVLPEFNTRQALLDCPFGCQVMWRRQLHETEGMFDPAFKIAGDYEFFLRVALRHGASHIAAPLALYHESPDNLSYQDQPKVMSEVKSFLPEYQKNIPIENIYEFLKTDNSPLALTTAYFNFAGLLLGGANFGYGDPEIAEYYYRKALELNPGNPIILNNLACALCAQGNRDGAGQVLKAIGGNYPIVQRNIAALIAGHETLQLVPVTDERIEGMPALQPSPDARIPIEEYMQKYPQVQQESRREDADTATGIDAYIEKTDGNFLYISADIYPQSNTDDELRRFIELIATLPPYYLYYGGVGDGLLALASFYDNNPQAVIVCMSNSPAASKSFLSAFPGLQTIYLFPPVPHGLAGLVFRSAVPKFGNCLGMGVTPPGNYEDTWKPDLNIFKSPYNIAKYPRWAQSFKSTKLQPFQVVLAPKGSVYGTFRSKRNTLDPKYWPVLLEFLKANNIRPVVIGTPDENTAYPLDENCIDRRSWSFKDQMEVIASSDLFIGADSWGKTFSAMAGISTIVFKAMMGPDLAYWQDNSDFVFIKPWENIALIDNLPDFLKVCDEVFKRNGRTLILPQSEQFLKAAGKRKLLPDPQQMTSFDPVFWTRDYKSFKKVLIRSTPAIGDALMLTAVARSFKKNFPDNAIYISGDERAEWIFKNNPYIAGFVKLNSNEELRIEVDAEVIECNHIVDRLPEYYNGLHYMDILGNIAGVQLDSYELDYQMESDEKIRAEQLLKTFKRSGEMLVGVQLTTNKDVWRSYTAPDFLPKLFKEFPQAKFILFGQETPGFKNDNFLDCAESKIPFRDQVALAAHCDAFITIDSAFYHIAHNLFKKPTLLITSVTNEALIGNPELGLTYPVRNAKNGCFPCYWQKECKRTCLKELAPDDVVKAFKEMLLKVQRNEFPLWKPNRERVEIEIATGENYQQKIAQTLFKNPTSIIFKTTHNLPAYAANWNGITSPHFTENIMKTLQSPFRPKNAEESAAVNVDLFQAGAVKNEQKLPQINLVWEGSQFVNHSLALINREHAANVIKSGVAEVTVVPYEPDQFAADGDKKLELLKEHDVRFKKPVPEAIAKLPYAWIRHQWPPKAEPPRGAKWIIMQPWEYSSVPKDFINIFKSADEIWTPSNFARNAFVNAGVDFDKVQIVPNGINPDVFTPSGNPVDFPVDKRLKFLFVGGTIFRKGIDILLKAYTQAFTAADDVCLVIKDMGGDSFYKGQTAKELIEQIKRDPNAPEIRYTDAIMPETQLADLYRACDVFVSPYRGEGFSLPALEAMACGLPVIVTDGGATDDFADENTGWKIPASPRAIGRNFDGREMADEAFVLEPDAEYLAELLKDIYDNPQDIPVKGIAAALRARSEWTWNRATLKMLSRLDYLYQTTMSRDAGNVLKDTDDGNILIGRAENLYNRGDVDGAIEHYTQAFKAGGLTEKYILHALHRMASIALADNNTELATDFIFKADEIHAGHVDTIYLYSLCLGLQEKWTEAQEQLTEILNHWKEVRFDTTLGLTLDMLLCDTARALLSTGAVEEAHEIYSEALKMNPESADACYGVAQCFKNFGNHEEARSMLEWAVKLRPDFTLAVEELDIIRN